MTAITPKQLIDWGHKPGAWFPLAVAAANAAVARGKGDDQMMAEQTVGIDARFFCGVTDVSELPGAYKNAASMRAQIAQFGLAEIVDAIEPYGSIMAADWQRDAPWRKKKDEQAKPE